MWLKYFFKAQESELRNIMTYITPNYPVQITISLAVFKTPLLYKIEIALNTFSYHSHKIMIFRT